MQGKVITWDKDDFRAAGLLGQAGMGILLDGYLLSSTSLDEMTCNKFEPASISVAFEVEEEPIEVPNHIWMAFRSLLSAVELFDNQTQAFRLLIEHRRGYA